MREESLNLIARQLAAHPGRLAVVSSSGTEAAVLLHMVASEDKTLLLIFLDNGMSFGVTQTNRVNLPSFHGLEEAQVSRP